MAVAQRNFGVGVLLLGVGVAALMRFSQNLFHYAQNVRTVDVVGVSGGGAACGAAIFALVMALTARAKA